MKKRSVFLFFCLSIQLLSHAQESRNLKGNSHLVSLDINAPVGVFARSQFAGAGFNYSWSNHRFGSNIQRKKLIGFTVNAGVDYFLGRKIKVAGHNFRYDGYIYGRLMPGILINPWSNGNFTLAAGPTIGMYQGNAEVGFGVNLFGACYLHKKISIGPGVTYKKHSQTDALWTAAARASFTF